MKTLDYRRSCSSTSFKYPYEIIMIICTNANLVSAIWFIDLLVILLFYSNFLRLLESSLQGKEMALCSYDFLGIEESLSIQ